MKFLIDAPLPRRIAHRFNDLGHDATHTLDYPQRNQTPGEGIVQIAEMESRIVVTKDSDFVDRFLLKRQPKKLLMISSGNITNKDLDALLLAKIPLVAAAFENNCYIEINRNAVIVHS